MKNIRVLFASFLFFQLLMPGICAPISAAEAEAAPGHSVDGANTHWISAADPRFHYDGRFDFSDSNAPVVIWEASQISLDFGGNTLTLLFDQSHGQNFFDAQVDGSNAVVAIPEAKSVSSVRLSQFGDGHHHLRLFKRSEAAAGTVRFLGAEIGPNATAWRAPIIPYRVRMAFFGDSITVGACDEDGAADQWKSRRTHDSAFSYAALIAAAYSADYRNFSVSGMGVVLGWVDPKAGEIWDRIYPNPASPRADLSQWQPQIVFVNFGENDASFSATHGQAFPTNYTADYVSLVQAIRHGYPAAQIVCLRGGMVNGATNKSLRRAWDAAVAQLETTNKSVSHFVFTHWTRNHPRVADHRIMADELIAWLRQQKFMQAYE